MREASVGLRGFWKEGLLKHLGVISACFWLIWLFLPQAMRAATVLPPTALIVDDLSPQFQRFGPSAHWRAVIVPDSTAYYASGMIWTANTTDVIENYVTWTMPTQTLTSTFAITHEVFVFIPKFNADTQHAEYQIVHSGFTSTKILDQSQYFAEWVSLGKYLFASAGEGMGDGRNLVQLTDATREPYGTQRVGFDAVAFVPEITSTLTDTSTLTRTVFLPTVQHGKVAVASSSSRYVSTIDTQAHYKMGCAAGQNNERGTIVLAFGQPYQVGFGYGTFMYDYVSLISTQQIAEAAKSFIRGYGQCAPDEYSLDLVLGTSNYKGETNALHGAAWAGMINDIHAWLTTSSEAKDWSTRISVSGGSDMEPSWNTAANTRAWVEGYGSLAIRPFYNFGSCDGCPTGNNPSAQPNNGWTLEDIWYVSYGANKARAFPEIYARSGIHARQWQYISLYAALQKGARIEFAGVLTQYQACQDRDPSGCRADGLDNTPQQGWEQMQDVLNADTRTTQVLPTPSDITWLTIR